MKKKHWETQHEINRGNEKIKQFLFDLLCLGLAAGRTRFIKTEKNNYPERLKEFSRSLGMGIQRHTRFAPQSVGLNLAIY
jgi:hypothetical protein